MSRAAWIIIFSVLLATIGATVALVVVVNRESYLQIDPEKILQPKSPTDTKVSDDRILQLEAQLKESDQEARFEAISLLGAIAENDPERLGPVLLRAINNEDHLVRFSVANKLGRNRYAAAAPALTNTLDDQDQRVSVQAIESLVKLDEAGLRAVMEALTENKIKNIDAALNAIGRITGRSFAPGKKGRHEALEYWAKRNK